MITRRNVLEYWKLMALAFAPLPVMAMKEELEYLVAFKTVMLNMNQYWDFELEYDGQLWNGKV